MADYTEAVERINALSKVPVRCVFLGVQWLSTPTNDDWLPDGFPWKVDVEEVGLSEEHHFPWDDDVEEACLSYATDIFDLHYIKLERISALDNYKTQEYGDIQVCVCGQQPVRQLLEELESTGLDPLKIFSPFWSENELLTGVRYAHRIKRPICSAAETSEGHDSNSDGRITEKHPGNDPTVPVEQSISGDQITEKHSDNDPAVPVKQSTSGGQITETQTETDPTVPVEQSSSGKQFIEEVASRRHLDCDRQPYVSNGEVPEILTVHAPWWEVKWYFEVVVHDLQAAIIEAINRHSPETTSGDLPGVVAGIQTAGSKVKPLPSYPELDKQSTEWILLGELVQGEWGWDAPTLRTYRDRGDKAKEETSGGPAMYGTQENGMFWRRDPLKLHNIWYLVSTIVKKSKRRKAAPKK